MLNLGASKPRVKGGGLGLGLLPVNGFLGPIHSERLRRRNFCVMFTFSRYESYIDFLRQGSHSDWNPGKMGRRFPVREKSHKILENVIYQLY